MKKCDNNSILVLYSGHQIDYLKMLLEIFSRIPEYNFTILDSARDKWLHKKYKYSNNVIIIPIIIKKTHGMISLFEGIRYYHRIFKYILFTEHRKIHIEWINFKVMYFEYIFYYMLRMITPGRRYILKIHDINPRYMIHDKIKEMIIFKYIRGQFYKIMDTILVHNKYTKNIIKNTYNACNNLKIVNHPVRETRCSKTKADARKKLGYKLNKKIKIILSFGALAPYKNVESLIKAGEIINNPNLFIIIAGAPKKETVYYAEKISKMVAKSSIRENIFFYPEYISSDIVCNIFTASDVCVLPYKYIYQSGVLFLSYAFKRPVIVKDVGALSESVIPGETGMIYKNDENLAQTINDYFNSVIFKNPNKTILRIQQYVLNNYSFMKISRQYKTVYR